MLNVGNNATVTLTGLVEALERAFGTWARITYASPEPGNVPQTWASIDNARALLGYDPRTSFVGGRVTLCRVAAGRRGLE